MSRRVLAGAAALLVGFLGGMQLHQVVASPDEPRPMVRAIDPSAHRDDDVVLEDCPRLAMAPPYPVNENGMSYGSGATIDEDDPGPDLVAAYGTNGRCGFVRASDREAGDAAQSGGGGGVHGRPRPGRPGHPALRAGRRHRHRQLPHRPGQGLDLRCTRGPTIDSMTDAQIAVQELRITLTVDDFDAAVRLYRDALGLPEVADWSSDQGRVLLLDAGRATLELFDEAQAAMVDDLEVGERVSGKVRLALQVPDADAAASTLVAAGATAVAPAVDTPWGDRNARVAAPDGMQLTLFTLAGES